MELSPATLKALDALSDRVREKTADRPRLALIFKNALLNTLQTTVKRMPDGTTFVITGDIPAMWLRDSAAQVRPFLALAHEAPELADMIEGLVARQVACILSDPYANAFNEGPTGQGHQADLTDMKPYVWERKYEIDSLCYPLHLAYLLWKRTGRASHLSTTEFAAAARTVIATWRTEQHHESRSPYSFERRNCPPSDTLEREGRGAEVGYTGMTWSGFRPSDDACRYGYLVPANMFAVVALKELAEIAEDVLRDAGLARDASALAREIDEGIRAHGIVEHPDFGPMYAYETDGFGRHYLMDDANVPSLLSIPYLGYAPADDPVYLNTRRFVLSRNNPYYFEGAAASGIGSPHTPPDYVWHIALAMQGLTSPDPGEKRRMLELMADTDAGLGMMHEGFHKDDPSRFSREWFSWANMMYCELLMDYCGIRAGAESGLDRASSR